MKLILPFALDMTFTAYQKRGYEFGIISAVKQDTRPWLLSKYCNLRYLQSSNAKFDFVITDGEWFLNDGVFQSQVIRSRKRTSSFLDFDWIDIIIKHLKNGIYVYGYFDEYFIPGKSAFNKYHFKHSFFIYGFDDEAGTFYAAGYTGNDKFEPYEISITDFTKALDAVSHTDLNFIRLNPAFEYAFDPRRTFFGLYDYTYSLCTLSEPESNTVYGIDATRKMADYICGCISGPVYADLRYSRFLFEFKQFMRERIKYLKATDFIHCDTALPEELCETYRKLHLLFIKYDLTGHATVFDGWPEELIRLADEERRYMLSLLDDYAESIKRKESELHYDGGL